MVESKSGNRPHLVTAGKGNKFSCDGDCANFKAFGICSHVVAVASINQMLPAFLDMFQKQKKLPNLTSLAMAGMPRGRGHKGGKPPRKRNRVVSEMRVPFNPISILTSVATGASSAMRLNDSGSLPMPFLNNELSDSPVGSSYFHQFILHKITYHLLLLKLLIHTVHHPFKGKAIHYHLVVLIYCRHPLFHSNKLQH